MKQKCYNHLWFQLFNQSNKHSLLLHVPTIAEINCPFLNLHFMTVYTKFCNNYRIFRPFWDAEILQETEQFLENSPEIPTFQTRPKYR